MSVFIVIEVYPETREKNFMKNAISSQTLGQLHSVAVQKLFELRVVIHTVIHCLLQRTGPITTVN